MGGWVTESACTFMYNAGRGCLTKRERGLGRGTSVAGCVAGWVSDLLDICPITCLITFFDLFVGSFGEPLSIFRPFGHQLLCVSFLCCF